VPARGLVQNVGIGRVLGFELTVEATGEGQACESLQRSVGARGVFPEEIGEDGGAFSCARAGQCKEDTGSGVVWVSSNR
jgi:hypothetical protein